MSSDSTSPATLRGIDYLKSPGLNKGMGFSIEERQLLGIHGLLPPAVKTQDEMAKQTKDYMETLPNPLAKYCFLADLQENNEKLFYRMLHDFTEEMMPLVYTPTVGLACQKFGFIYQRPRGLFISIHDAGNVYSVLKNWPEQDVRAICVTDGERILGLGDLGVCGMGIPVGKLSLYTALAGIKPHQLLPITLDVGTNNKEFLKDPNYIGLRQERVTGKQYEDFIDEFMKAVVKRYGQNCLIQFEDFANHNAFVLLDKYRDKYCTFNDDIQGTASVGLAGIVAALRLTKVPMKDNVFLFLGAGEAATGIAFLIVRDLIRQGLTHEEAVKRIWLCDSKGLVVKSRSGLTDVKKIFAKDTNPIDNFLDIVNFAKPTAIIGASAQAGAFTKEILTTMGRLHEHPIIFALSNPTSKAECTAEQAYTHTEGRAIFASGSPFPPFEYKGRTLYPGQGNNAYIFPGVALGIICAGIKQIGDDVFLEAAYKLASLMDEADLKAGRLYPDISKIYATSIDIAVAVVEKAYLGGYASTYPEPANKAAFVKAQLYDFSYKRSIPKTWSLPGSKSHA